MSEFSTFYTRYLRALAVFSIGLAGAALLTTLLNRDQPNIILFGGFLIANLTWLALLNQGRTALATYGVLASLLVVVVINPLNERFLVSAVVALATAALLARTEVFALVNVLVFGRLTISALPILAAASSEMPPDFSRVGGSLAVLAFVSIVLRYFSNGGRRAIQASRASAELLQAASDVIQPLAQITNRDELLKRAVTLIQTRFGHYHAQIFLINETRDQALLAASSGEIGQQLLERGHQLSIGSQSVIGQVMLRGAAMLVSDTKREAVYYANALLPETRAEIALPIRDGAQTIGALDLQSRTPNAFSKAEITALQIVADLLASALRGTRWLEQQEQTADVNERLQRADAANLHEIERLNQQLTRIAWQEYQSERRGATGITLDGNRVLPSSEWSAALLRAGQEAHVVRETAEGGTIAVPVTLRGEVIGAIEVEAGAETSPETIEMVQAVAQRLALSVENARLYEVTLQAAAQEQRINNIAARFQSVATVDELMRIALGELGDILGAERGSIRLGQFTEEQQTP